MAKFKVIKLIDFGNGFLHDRNGNLVPMQNFAPKIGDIIELGELKTKNMWSSAPLKGYDFIVHQEGVSPNGLLWIMADAVELVPNSTQITNTTNKSTSRSNFTTKNIIIGLLAIGIVIGGLRSRKFL